MAITEGHEFFEKLSERTNRYQAVAMIAAEARKRAEKCNNLISHSEALSWVLTGEKPMKLVRAEMRGISMRSDKQIKSIIYEIVLSVDDKEVSEAAEQSIYKTMQNKNLVYVYNNIQDEPRRSRVRILTRMIWDKICKCCCF